MSHARDPYPDALRAIALLIVVLGHWVATLPRFEQGVLVDTGHILDAWEPAGFFTWIVQVVPLFIFVSAAVSSEGVWQRYRSGESHARWWADRALGLARPTVTYLAVLSVLVAIASFVTRDGVLGPLNHSLTVHLWFLLILLAVQLMLPISVWADRRFGLWPAAVLIIAIAVVDLLRSRPTAFDDWLMLGQLVTSEHNYFAWVNTLFFWLLPQQLGIAWWNNRFSGRRVGAALLLLGLAWLMAAVALGYPPSMVNGNVGGETNLLPPTLALLGVMWFQVGLVVLFETPVRRFLQRQRLGRWMAMIGAFGLQLYLWHKLAELPAAWLGQRLDWPIDAGMPGEPGFWIGRLEWLALCALMVVPVMLAALLIERYRKQDVPAAMQTGRIIVGGLALFLGIAVSLALGAFPGALIGLPLVALSAWLLRAPRQA
jgi:surface polysaccharide O-acyltransferase-like enzyme